MASAWHGRYTDFMRFVGERRALAAAVLAFFTLQYLFSGLLGDNVDFRAMFVGLGVAYGMGFFGIVAGWFWSRWYSLGLSFTGFLMYAYAAYKLPPNLPDELEFLRTLLYSFAGAHALVGLLLLGPQVGSVFEGRRDWRERWKMDENAVNRLGKAITRAGASLPYLIIGGLAPRQNESLIAAVAALSGLSFGLVGLVGLVRLRSWAILALTAAGATAAAAALLVPGPAIAVVDARVLSAPWVAVGLLVAAIAPFVRPTWRHLSTH